MCGITGTLNLSDYSVIYKMTRALASRGPDDQGFYLDKEDRIALGHRRLAIIDLSPAGHQPMSYADGRYWVTYNGEIYNYASIQEILKAKGYTFKSNSDTEVILAAYNEYGPACLEHFRGMFAFAIWDKTSKTLFLARDRFGIKPLYWSMLKGTFLFGSELTALLASGLISRQLNPDTLWNYLSYGSVQAPSTILIGVYMLLPGHYMTVKGQDISIHQYWDLQKPTNFQVPAKKNSELDLRSELRRLLEESIYLHMIADVPVGAFLSGGVDSTAVVGLMSRLLNKPIKTFSIGFQGPGEEMSEVRYAKIAAERFDTDHHEIILNGDDLAREFHNFIEAIDQPSCDGVNTYFISRATGSEVKVALSGLGGDEMFAGYRHFYWLNLMEKPLIKHNPLIPFVAKIASRSKMPKLHKMADILSNRDYAKQYLASRRLFSEQEKLDLASSTLKNYIHLNHPDDVLQNLVIKDLDVLARTSYLEAKTYMANTLLRDTDATSMTFSLEVRVPLLDHVLAQFAFNLPPEFKLRNGHTKHLFIHSLQDVLPPESVNHPKTGFELPMRQWIANNLWDTVQEVLTSKQAHTILSEQGIERILRHAGEALHPYTKVWSLVVLIAWMNLHGCYL